MEKYPSQILKALLDEELLECTFAGEIPPYDVKNLPRLSDSWNIIFAIEESTIGTSGNEQFILKSGFTILPPFFPFALLNGKILHIKLYNKSLSLILEETSKNRLTEQCECPPESRMHQEFKQLARMAYDDQKSKEDCRVPSLIKALLNTVIIAFKTPAPYPKTVARRRENMLKIAGYVRNNINRKVTLKEAASVTGISEQYINKTCRLFRDQSFNIYANLFKLEEARKLLKSTNQKIGEISELLNFKNSDYFIQLFKKYYNTTPLQFRKKIQSTDIDLEEINWTLGFDFLSENTEALVSDLTLGKDQQYAIIIANFSKEPMECFWVHENGYTQTHGYTVPGARFHTTSPPKSCWIIKNKEGETMRSFKTTRKCGIYVIR